MLGDYKNYNIFLKSVFDVKNGIPLIKIETDRFNNLNKLLPVAFEDRIRTFYKDISSCEETVLNYSRKLPAGGTDVNKSVQELHPKFISYLEELINKSKDILSDWDSLE